MSIPTKLHFKNTFAPKLQPMDLSKVRMVVTDMDGTLLNSNHEVSPLFFDLYDKLRNKNVEVVAASGRQYHSMTDKLSPIADDMVFIAENGAIIRHRQETLLTTPLPLEFLDEITLFTINDRGTLLIIECAHIQSWFVMRLVLLKMNVYGVSVLLV